MERCLNVIMWFSTAEMITVTCEDVCLFEIMCGEHY